MPSIGNDVVDLGDPENQNKHSNTRLLKRICSPSEMQFVVQSKDPHVALWMLWSIKEASYKALFKHFEGVRFIPNQFVCTSMQKDLHGWECNYKGYLCQVRMAITPKYVHAVALVGDGMAWEKVLVSTELVEKGINPSDAVRQLAVRLLEERGYSGCSIVRLERGGVLLPPQAFKGNEHMANCDVSLSHDGRFIAAVVILDVA